MLSSLSFLNLFKKMSDLLIGQRLSITFIPFSLSNPTFYVESPIMIGYFIITHFRLSLHRFSIVYFLLFPKDLSIKLLLVINLGKIILNSLNSETILRKTNNKSTICVSSS